MQKLAFGICSAFALTLLAGCRHEPPSAAAEPSALPNAPADGSSVPAPPSSLALVLDPSGIHFSGERTILVPLPADPARGADATFKRRGAFDLYLVPLGAALEREKKAGRLRRALRIIVQKTTAYQMLVETLFTAGQSFISEYELCEDSCGARSFRLRLPDLAQDDRRPLGEPALDLRALIVNDGIVIKASGAGIAPGCKGPGPGTTIPRRDGALDLPLFAACVAKLRSVNPAFAAEKRAGLAGARGTPFRELMDLALALEGPDKQLFSNLSLLVPK